VARAYLRSAERLLDQLEAGETGVEKYEVASNEDPGVETVAELVQSVAAEHGHEVDVELVENPRAGEETLVSEFPVDTTAAREQLGWETRYDVESVVRERFETDGE
jgi:nucleoside-diphosphate-sugar epimerase